MPSRLRTLAGLSLAEHLLLAQAAAGLVLTRSLLKLGGYTRAARALERLARVPLAPRLKGDDAARARATARLVYAAGARFPLRATCLPKSLVLRALLLRQGIACDFRIGVRIVEGRLEGHAWVEHAGEPLSQEAAVAEKFRPFPGDLSAVGSWVQ